jgi:polycystin 1
VLPCHSFNPFFLSGPDELQSFSHVFSNSFSHNMAERHMWLSVFNRPDHSRFTRVQRITCCVTLVLLYMFVDAMWYGFFKDQSDKAASISWHIIGWEEVIIAIVSTIIIFPVALILICTFKRSRSKVKFCLLINHAARKINNQ